MVEIWLFWVPFIIGILSFLFCRFCLSKYDWTEHKNKPYKIRLWLLILYFIWALIPLANWGCIGIILIAFIEDRYELKPEIVEFCKENKFFKVLNKKV